MPRVFDNIDQSLLPALQHTLDVSDKADFCIGYFNLRGWKQLDHCIENWAGGPEHCVRLLVGMQRLPQDELQEAFSLVDGDGLLDNPTVLRLKKRLAEEFRQQLTIGAPNNEDEYGLRRLARQIRKKQVVVKLFLRHSLHAKLYLLFRPDIINPIVGYVGSSNLTFAGLAKQGELNVDVLDVDACQKLAKWFQDRWDDRWCIDISDDLAAIIDDSWAREHAIPPYHIYIKMAYHLSQEARAGLTEFQIPSDFGNKLLKFQTAAVKIAAHHLNKRGGVLIGDVVGLGKTLMATALARVFEDDYGLETLIICPKNLVSMWEDYRSQYRLRAHVLSISRVAQELPDLRRYRLVVLDESHNLRNREGKRYRIIQEYIRANDSKCILLSATPYNKTYLDLSNQLRLFVPDDEELGVRPERLLREIGETEFTRRHQASTRSLAAFEKSPFPDDWRELMRLYLVRRTRSFIQDNYAQVDPSNGRPYLLFDDGSRSYFPTRVPRTVRFQINEKDSTDQYARLYSADVVQVINALTLPRYGLGNYVAPAPKMPPTPQEGRVLDDLSRAGNRLLGFSRTNLFKRLESSGYTFLLSVERHILRNYIFLHAIENELPLPIGTFDAQLLDPQTADIDTDAVAAGLFDDDEQTEAEETVSAPDVLSREQLRTRAEETYRLFAERHQRRFRWLRPALFVKRLAKDLQTDADALSGLLLKFGRWDKKTDNKLAALAELILRSHPREKVLVFTQFADTVHYLDSELRQTVNQLGAVTGGSPNVTELAWRFSPRSNRKQIDSTEQLRVLIATDVLSEGQNLQDCSIVVNYDLPWAIIRLIQRAGRVDRIGQQADQISCYSFLPADGIERVIRLRARVRARLQENAEVVGTDEAFFEGDDQQAILDLYNEKAGVLDGDDDREIDLSSYAYQIWNNAITADPKLRKTIEDMPAVVYSAKSSSGSEEAKGEGVLVYVRTHHGNDSLAWIDGSGSSVTQSQFDILKAAECDPNTPAARRSDNHHELVRAGAQHIAKEEKQVGGQLGRPSGARFRTYERLMRHADAVKGTLFDTDALRKAIDDVHRYPLRPIAIDVLNRQLKSGISDHSLADLVVAMREEDRLSIVTTEAEQHEPLIICSLGLVSPATGGKA